MGFHLVNGVRASCVEMICEIDFVRYVIQKIHAFMIVIRILSISLPTLATLHTPHTRLTRVIPVETILILVMIVPRFSLNYEPEPGYIQNYTSYPHDSPSFPQQYLCCDNCGGLHETFQCQLMNQNLYNSNSSGFDQTQPPQFPVIHPPHQETSIEILHDQKNAINSVQTFLRKFNRYSFFETPKVLLLAWDRVFEIKDAFGNKEYKSEDIQELFRKLFNDVQNIHEELAEYINTTGWNRPAFYNNGDDDDVDYTIAIIPVLSIEEPDNSLSMGDEHLDTIPTTELDKVIKSSVEDLVPILSESEEISSGSTTTHYEISLSEYDSFIYNLSNDQFPPTDRSDFTHEEFADELAHIISPSEYDCFYFRNLPDPGEWISILNSVIRENLSSTTRVNLPVEDDLPSFGVCCMDPSFLSHVSRYSSLSSLIRE
nr:hypothetical protein [Tanacetum cinerariifolium]